jgi:hypothetical protein
MKLIDQGRSTGNADWMAHLLQTIHNKPSVDGGVQQRGCTVSTRAGQYQPAAGTGLLLQYQYSHRVSGTKTIMYFYIIRAGEGRQVD